MSGNVDAERKLLQGGWQQVPKLDFDELGFAENAPLFRIVRPKVPSSLARHSPANPTFEQVLPGGCQPTLPSILAPPPPGNVHQQRTLGEVPILGEVLARIAGEQECFAVGKQVLQCQVNRPDCAVEVDRAEQLRPDSQKPHQSRHPTAVDGEPRFAEKAVAEQAFQVERALVVARHVAVTQDKVHVVHGVQATEQAAKHGQPTGHGFGILRLWPRNQVRHILRPHFFAVLEHAIGSPANSTDQISQLFANDYPSQGLMRQPKLREKVGVEEVPKRPMANIVQQGTNPHHGLNAGRAGGIWTHSAKAFVKLPHGTTGQVHGSQNVLEPRVFGRRKYPPGGLQLVDVPQSLDPRMIHQVTLGYFARGAGGSCERDIAMNRVMAQAFGFKMFHAIHSTATMSKTCGNGATNNLSLRPESPSLHDSLGSVARYNRTLWFPSNARPNPPRSIFMFTRFCQFAAIAALLTFGVGPFPHTASAQEAVTQAKTKPVVHEGIVYGKGGDVELKLDLAEPATGNGPFPTILFVHGGGWAAGKRQGHRAQVEEAARRGYIADAILVVFRLVKS